ADTLSGAGGARVGISGAPSVIPTRAEPQPPRPAVGGPRSCAAAAAPVPCADVWRRRETFFGTCPDSSPFFPSRSDLPLTPGACLSLRGRPAPVPRDPFLAKYERIGSGTSLGEARRLLGPPY